MQKMGTRSIALILIVLLAATACSKKEANQLEAWQDQLQNRLGLQRKRRV